MKLKNITVKYGWAKALDDISLEIDNSNKIVGLLGENGSGKTTLINVLLKNINRFKGQRTIDGSCAYMPDRFFIYESMRINSAIKLFKQVYKDFDERRMFNILKLLDISPKLKLHSCSKGMHELIHLALVFSRNTDFYLLDEPLAAVDPIKREQFINIIKNYRRKNSTVIMVTHLLKDLGDTLDEVIFFKKGQIISQSKKQDLLDKYGNIEKAYVGEVGK